jgi:hypothetical protein
MLRQRPPFVLSKRMIGGQPATEVSICLYNNNHERQTNTPAASRLANVLPGVCTLYNQSTLQRRPVR